MAYGETAERRASRLERQRRVYPELEVLEPAELGKIDRIFRARGEPPTTLGARFEQEYAGEYGDYALEPAPQPPPRGYRGIPPPSDGGSRRGLFGALADIGRDVVPQGVRDVAGRAARDTYEQVSSSERLLNELVPGRDVGTSGLNQVRRIPKVGPTLATALDIGLAPATIGTAGIGPGAAASFKSLPLAARIPLNIAAPASRSANFGTRLAAETAIGTGATVGAQEAAKRTDNPLLIGAAGLGAGILASGAVSAAPRAGRLAKSAATGYRDLTENLPVGMSIRDTPERIPMGEITPYDVRGTLADISDLTKRADSLRAKIAKNPANRGAMRELGEAEAMITLRHAAIEAGSDPEEMLRAIERAAQQVSEYTADARAPKGGRMIAPTFGSPERAAYEADLKAFRGPKQRGGSLARRAAGAPFDGPMQAVRDYEDTLVRMMGGELGDLVRKSSPLEIARTKILDATKREAQLRNSGVADLEIGSGRAKQAAGIRSGLESAQDLGGAEMIRQARAGAKVGQMRTVLAEAIDLSDDEVGAIITETMRRQPSAFSALQMGDIIDRLRDGRGLQPAQINTVRDVLGKEVADSLSLRPASAEPRNITPAMIKRMQDELAKEAESAPEAAAKRQTAANTAAVDARMRSLGESARTAPPPPKPSDVAFERAALDPDAKWNEAQAPAIRRARKQVEAWQKGQQSILKQQARDLQRQADVITAMERLNARAVTAADTREMRGAAKVLRDAQREEARVGAIAARESRIAARAAKNYPTPDEIMRQVDAAGLSPEAREVASQWVEGNRRILDRVETGGVFEPLRQISATFKGDVKDSFLNAVLVRESLLSSVLQEAGTSDKVAKQVARALSDRELMLRYGVSAVESLPDGVVDTLKSARTIPYGDSIAGLVKLNQEAKSTMFGLGDFGVFGTNVHAAVMNGGVPGMVGLLNRTAGLLHLPHVQTLMADSALPKRLQNAVDGLDVGTSVSGLTEGGGSLLRHIPKVGEPIDRLYTKLIDAYSEFQFGTIMGTVRDIMYEGNLVLAKATGSDLTDPLVRAQAANASNHITSSAQLATKAGRRELEGAMFTSAKMNRARFARINDMAKLLSPKATKEERLFASTIIASNVFADVLLGKLVYDMIGVGEFEADPSKPGFGRITTKFKDSNGRNIIWDYMPQDSVQRAFAQSIRALGEGDPEEAATAWARAGIGSASPVGRVPLAGVGLSYQPGKGYGIFRDAGTPADRIKSMIPVPPLVQAVARGESEPYQIGTQVLAEGAYPESPTAAAQRPDFDYGSLKGEAQQKAVKAEAWRIVVQDFGGIKDASFYDWYDRQVEKETRNYQRDGLTFGEAKIEAEKFVERQPEAKAYRRFAKQMGEEWAAENPEGRLELLDREMAKDQPRIPAGVR